MSSRVIGVTALLAAMLATGCASVGGEPAAHAQLQPTRGNTAAGRVTFTPREGGVDLVATVTGLTPGRHGFHVHEKGDCSAPDAISAGGHFNPAGHAHGHPSQSPRHAGDLPMLEADAAGNATLKAFLPGLAIAGGPSAVAGRAVVVHAAADDFKSQPAGNSGARVACGVIAAR